MCDIWHSKTTFLLNCSFRAKPFGIGPSLVLQSKELVAVCQKVQFRELHGYTQAELQLWKAFI
jgi:hypothetical protein